MLERKWRDSSLDQMTHLRALASLLNVDPTNKKQFAPTLRKMIIATDLSGKETLRWTIDTAKGAAHRVSTPEIPAGEAVRLAVDLLCEIDLQACEDLVPTLLSWLQNDDEKVRLLALDLLQRVGSQGKSAIPTLQLLLDHGTRK